MMDEINEKANTLYQIVLAIINLKSADRNTIESRKRKLIAGSNAISLLMKARNQNMSAAPYVVSLLLLKGGITKMASIFMHNYICSYESILEFCFFVCHNLVFKLVRY